MIKKIFISIFSLASFVFAQQNPNVELPDFIITGTDVIAVQGAQKVSPEFVSTISEQFFKPVYSPEELEVRDLSSPLKNDLNILDSLNYFRGSLEFGAGIYSLPTANLSYLFPFEGFVLGGRLTGENHRAHVENSERYLIDGGLNLLYTTDDNSEFLPGTQFKLNGDFGSTSYKFYDPTAIEHSKRTLNQGNFSFGISNQMNRQFNFDLSINDNLSSITSMAEKNYNENILSLKGFSKVNFSSFNISASAEYKKQFLTIENTTNIPNSDEFFTVRPTVGLNLSDAIKVSGGLTYSKSGGNNYTAPFAAVSFKINNYFSVFGEYSPHAEFLTSDDILKTNRYYDPQNFYNFFFKKRSAFTAAAKFEYDKYYQINFGIRYFTSPEYPYLRDSSTTGKFILSSVKDVNSFTIFADLLYHLGPSGIMYGNIELAETKSQPFFIPYYPRVKISVLYGYNFDFGLRADLGLDYINFTDSLVENTDNFKGYFDLNLKLLYKIVPEFFFTVEFSNLLNSDIKYWKGYEEAPLDVIAGFKYLW